MSRSLSTARALFAAVALSAVSAVAAHACTICLNSDPSAFADPSKVQRAGRWRFTLENRTHSRTSGLEGAPIERYYDFQHEHRVLLQVANNPTMRLGVSASMPWMSRRHRYGEGDNRYLFKVDNMGDLDLQARYDLFVSHTPGRYRSTALIGGVTVPIGASDVSEGGVRLPEHNQPGQGAWSETIGFAQQLQINKTWAYASAIFKTTAENSNGYQYGDAFLATLEGGYRVTPRFAVIGGLVGRSTSREKYGPQYGGNAFLPVTGGEILSFTPGVQLVASSQISLRTQAWVNVWNHLNDYQKEDNNLMFSITFSP